VVAVMVAVLLLALTYLLALLAFHYMLLPSKFA
jgi:hypothetical protein